MLSPVLFSIYVQHMPSPSAKNYHLLKYADDTVLIELLHGAVHDAELPGRSSPSVGSLAACCLHTPPAASRPHADGSTDEDMGVWLHSVSSASDKQSAMMRANTASLISSESHDRDSNLGSRAAHSSRSGMQSPLVYL